MEWARPMEDVPPPDEETARALINYWRPNECKTHLCFEFISHAILSILYPCLCKTHNISSKLGFVGLLMKSK